jgi:hypothetical protein
LSILQSTLYSDAPQRRGAVMKIRAVLPR